MTKSILISIRPEHLINILNGKKTLELRKTAPFPLGRGRWVYLYCTKGGKGLFKDNDYFLFHNGNSSISLNGKVVARFWFDTLDNYEKDDVMNWHDGDLNLKNLCLTWSEVMNYAFDYKRDSVYAWHIKNLEIFDEPMSLSDLNIKRPPQSWQYINVKEEQ